MVAHNQLQDREAALREAALELHSLQLKLINNGQN
jgi:hypothetical protein